MNINGTDVRIYIDGVILPQSIIEVVKADHSQVQYIVEGLLSVDNSCISISSLDYDAVLLSIDKLLKYFSTQHRATIKYKNKIMMGKSIDVYCHKLVMVMECEEAATYKLIFNKV